MHNDLYLWVSGTMGWEPTTMYLYSAVSPLGAFINSSNAGHGWHTFTKGISGNSSAWNQTWTVRDGYLGAGSVWGKAAKLNVTLPAAKALCAKASDCAGFCFNDFDADPAASKLLSIAFKTKATDFVVRKTPLFEQFVVYINDHFTKTGSGQT